ncbi:MAG: glycosyl transferase [Lachnospiraceae bacterium]|jgi:hypothetical protein|nr:glycosyl transferase [Lachnospiraceae bacterium]
MSIKDNLLGSKIWTNISDNHPVFATKAIYRIAMKKSLNIKKPETLNEKMQWLKLYKYKDNVIVKKCADKYRVREYLKEKGCDSLLNELYGVWTSPHDIKWDELPERFVLKCTHGSGYNLIIEDKNSADIKAIEKKLDMWMHEKYGSKFCELIYEGISPRIIAEKYIETIDGKAPTDYKFFCSYGKPKFLYVMQGNDEIQDYYTADWEWLPVRSAGRPNSNNTLLKPEKYEEMLQYASILSKDFPIVRVDFYYEYGRVLFGEMTFLTTGGYTKYDPAEYDLKFGKMFPDVTISN